jgi:hypothetical protein
VLCRSRDPQPGLTIAPRTQHPYVYVGNDPVNKIDPLGLSWWDQLKKGVKSVIPESAREAWSKAKRGVDCAKRELRWSQRGVWVDRAMSLHPGYYLTKQVAREMNVLLGRPPEDIDRMLQQRYAAVVDTVGLMAVQVGISILCPPLGVALDGYEAVVGVDWMTGDKLSDGERALSFASFMWDGLELVDDVAEAAPGASLSRRMAHQEGERIAWNTDKAMNATSGGRMLGRADEMVDEAFGWRSWGPNSGKGSGRSISSIRGARYPEESVQQIPVDDEWDLLVEKAGHLGEKTHLTLNETRHADDVVDVAKRNTPFFAQEAPSSCGIACLRMAQGRLYGAASSEADIIQQLGTLYDPDGIGFSRIPDAAKIIGLKGSYFEDADINSLTRDFKTSGGVIILDVDAGVMYGHRPGRGPGSMRGHGVVLTDIQTGPSGLERLMIHDPSTKRGANQTIEPHLFVDAWEARWQRYVVVTAQ